MPTIRRKVYKLDLDIADVRVLRTMKEIAKYMRVESKTITKYAQEWGFPIAIDLAGVYFTTKGAIDLWILKIAARQHAERWGKKGDVDGEITSEETSIQDGEDNARAIA